MTTNTTHVVRLIIEANLMSPLSHISETVSTHAYLRQDPIIQPDGTVEEVFVYSGNALRGILRDAMAERVAAAAGGNLTLDGFHLLFSGGRISKEADVGFDRIRQLRKTLPILGLLGGGIGSTILEGKLAVGNLYPVVAEAIPVLPKVYHAAALKTEYRDVTHEANYTRRDDTKTRHRDQLREGAMDEERDGPADQMRMTNELVAAGTTLCGTIHAFHMTMHELGALVGGFADFAERPYLGGQARSGHGLVSLTVKLIGRTLNADPLLVIDGTGDCELSPLAQEALTGYEAHLAANGSQIAEVLACVR